MKPLIPITLATACLMAAVHANPAEMIYRSMAFPRPACVEAWMIDEGHALGFNDVCLHTEYRRQREQIIGARQHLVDSGAMERIEALGMTISLWTREWVDIDPAWGPATLDNPVIWEKVSERYDEILDVRFPEVDYIVFITAEVNIDLDEASWHRMVSLVHEKCRSRGKKLILRNFSHNPDELNRWPERQKKLDPDIIIQTKCVPIDWSLRARPHPLMGKSPGHLEFVEFDAGGEYFRRDYMMVGAVDHHEAHYAAAEAAGLNGVSIRVERYMNHLFRHPNFVNIYHLIGRAMGRFKNADESWAAWCRETYGPEIARRMEAILRPTGEVFAESIYIRDDIFGNSARDFLGGWTGEPRISTPYAWSYSPRNYGVKLFPDYDDSFFALIDSGDPAIVAEKSAGFNKALDSIDASIAALQELREPLGAEGFALHDWLLRETRFHLVLMREACFAWLKIKRLKAEGGTLDLGEKSALEAEIDTHLAAITALVPETEKTIEVNWQGRLHKHQRGSYYDLPRLVSDLRAWQFQ